MRALRSVGEVVRRAGYLVRAFAWAVVLGVLEMVGSERGRRALALLSLCGVAVAVGLGHPIQSIAPGEVGIRENRLTGGTRELGSGLALMVPGLHALRRYSLRDQVYRPLGSTRADGKSPYQSVEGLSIGVEVSVRYALDPAQLGAVARRLPEDVGGQLIEPVVDGLLHRTFARHTVREIFSTQRGEIQQALLDELRASLRSDGVTVLAVFLGNVDLPPQYRSGLEALLTEELSAEKMRYTLELKDKQVKQAELEAEADKVRRQKSAEASGLEEVIATRSREEAMQHVLPFKAKEIEQRRLEAEAGKVTRLKQAEADAESRRIESGGEADARRKLADSDAYRMDVTGRVAAEVMARESELIAKNPLLIQKALADKLSDKVQVIIAPPEAGGFFAGNLLGGPKGMGTAATSAAADDGQSDRQRIEALTQRLDHLDLLQEGD